MFPNENMDNNEDIWTSGAYFQFIVGRKYIDKPQVIVANYQSAFSGYLEITISSTT